MFKNCQQQEVQIALPSQVCRKGVFGTSVSKTDWSHFHRPGAAQPDADLELRTAFSTALPGVQSKGNTPGSQDWAFLGTSQTKCGAKHLTLIDNGNTEASLSDTTVFSFEKDKDFYNSQVLSTLF